jgi:thiosulfate/3-mercaptopyruvate sulfurtransferase
VPAPHPELIATKDEVLAAIGTQQACIVNALDADEYAGRGPVKYGRPGHIPSSVNVSFVGVVDPSTSAYLPEEELRRKFASVGALVKSG